MSARSCSALRQSDPPSAPPRPRSPVSHYARTYARGPLHRVKLVENLVNNELNVLGLVECLRGGRGPRAAEEGQVDEDDVEEHVGEGGAGATRVPAHLRRGGEGQST